MITSLRQDAGPILEPLPTWVKVTMIVGAIAVFYYIVYRGWHPFLRLKGGRKRK